MSRARTPMPQVTGLAKGEGVPAPPRKKPVSLVPPPPERDSEPDPVVGEGPSSRPAATKPSRPSRPAPASASASAGGTKAITLSLPVSLVDEVRAHAARERVSQARVLCDAVEATVDRLGDLVAQSQPRTSSTGLFVHRETPTSAERLVPLPLRMNAANVAVIDALVVEHEAVSRSQLCAAALRDYLG